MRIKCNDCKDNSNCIIFKVFSIFLDIPSNTKNYDIKHRIVYEGLRYIFFTYLVFMGITLTTIQIADPNVSLFFTNFYGFVGFVFAIMLMIRLKINRVSIYTQLSRYMLWVVSWKYIFLGTLMSVYFITIPIIILLIRFIRYLKLDILPVYYKYLNKKDFSKIKENLESLDNINSITDVLLKEKTNEQ